MIELIYQGRLSGLRLLILFTALTLTGIGLLTIYAATTDTTGLQHAWLRQGLWLMVSLAGFLAINTISYRVLAKSSYWLYSFSLALLVLVLLGKYLNLRWLVPSINGSYRWLAIGPLRLQPSELAKLAYILTLSWHLRRGDRLVHARQLYQPFLIALVPMFLILVEPDLGTVLLFLPILFTVLFTSGARMKHILLVLLAGAIVSPIFYFVVMKDYQRQRIAVLMNQDSDDPYWLRGPGYQLHESKIWVGSGGVTGQGWRQGDVIEHRMLPHRHNDFIFALIAHQWGFVGAAILVGLYLLLIVSGLEIASQQVDPVGRSIAVGVATLLLAQMFINTGVTIGLMPVTGMTLPFVSYGGSSLLSNYLALGLLINVARHRRQQLAAVDYEDDLYYSR